MQERVPTYSGPINVEHVIPPIFVPSHCSVVGSTTLSPHTESGVVVVGVVVVVVGVVVVVVVVVGLEDVVVLGGVDCGGVVSFGGCPIIPDSMTEPS